MTERPHALLLRADRIHDPAPTHDDALLLAAGRVVARGAFDDLRRRDPGAGILDLRGCTLTPGLTDAHIHLVEWALARGHADLAGAASPADAARTAARHAAGTPDRPWVLGGGWEPHGWTDPPHRDLLDDLIPDRPAALRSHDLHSVWANGAALRVAGITASTPDPEGGRIERDDRGEPTGVLRENAQALVLSRVPPPAEVDRRNAVLEGQRILHRMGVTGVHCVEPDSLGTLESIRGGGDLRLRVLQALPYDKLEDAIRLGLRSGFGGDWIRIGGIKLFLDGALGSRTALLRAPYEGTDDRGVATLPADAFREAVRRGAAAGLAMTVHAIGDAAVDLALDVLAGEGAALEGPIPHRIEHVQLVAPERLGDAGAAGIVCSVQPSHLMTDWRAADRHWGDRARTAYPFRSLAAGGAILAFGSDAPVEPPDPRHALYAATTRLDLAGEPGEGWFPRERIASGDALAACTTGPAAAAGDRRQGRLEPGSFADVVAWDRDPLAIPAGELLEMACVASIVGGEVVWRAER